MTFPAPPVKPAAARRVATRTRPANVMLIDLVDLLARAAATANQFLAEHRPGCGCSFCRAVGVRWERLDRAGDRPDPLDVLRRDLATAGHLAALFAAAVDGNLPGRVAAGDPDDRPA